MKKNWKVLDFVSSVGDMSGVGFSPYRLMLPGAGHQPLDLIFWLKFLLETRLESKSFRTFDRLSSIYGSEVMI